jgi:hypothetical protein
VNASAAAPMIFMARVPSLGEPQSAHPGRLQIDRRPQALPYSIRLSSSCPTIPRKAIQMAGVKIRHPESRDRTLVQ